MLGFESCLFFTQIQAEQLDCSRSLFLNKPRKEHERDFRAGWVEKFPGTG